MFAWLKLVQEKCQVMLCHCEEGMDVHLHQWRNIHFPTNWKNHGSISFAINQLKLLYRVMIFVRMIFRLPCQRTLIYHWHGGRETIRTNIISLLYIYTSYYVYIIWNGENILYLSRFDILHHCHSNINHCSYYHHHHGHLYHP